MSEVPSNTSCEPNRFEIVVDSDFESVAIDRSSSPAPATLTASALHQLNLAYKSNNTKKSIPYARSEGSIASRDSSVNIHAQDEILFDMLESSGSSSVKGLQKLMRDVGLVSTDRRLQEVYARMQAHNGESINFAQFKHIIEPANQLVDKALSKRLVIKDWEVFSRVIQGIYDECTSEKGGDVATYIPALADASADTWAVSFCSIDGQQLDIGDGNLPFSVQSCSKPLSYLIACQELGDNVVHRFVGREPSGRNFNELCLNSESVPHNPMINSGAIMTCSLIKHGEAAADRFEHVLQSWKKLSGYSSDIAFNNTVYLSEKSCANRNFCLAYMMQERKAFQYGSDKKSPPRTWKNFHLDECLDLYFQCCSLEATAHTMSIVAATLANGGVCPVTDERIFEAKYVKNCLSLMLSCGMYDYSGEWGFSIGLPAKSGVSGCVMIVIPNVGGFALLSPPLDKLGNSVRGVAFAKKLAVKFKLHFLDLSKHAQGEPDKNSINLDSIITKRSSNYSDITVALNFACAEGDFASVRALYASGADLNASDYDGRTALHVAASNGHMKIVQFLLNHGCDPNPIDRLFGTPLADAIREDHKEVAAYLQQHGGELANQQE